MAQQASSGKGGGLPRAAPLSTTAAPKQAIKKQPPASATAAAKTAGDEQSDQQGEEAAGALLWRDFLAQHQSWLTSMGVHIVLMLILGLIWFGDVGGRIIELSSAPPDNIEEFDELEEVSVDMPKTENTEVAKDIVDRLDPQPLEPKVDMEHAEEGVDAASIELSDLGMEHAPYNDLLSEVGRGTGTANKEGTGKGKKGKGSGLYGSGKGLGGRGGRRTNALKYGASPQSEAAVDAALAWLANHQLPDGSWTFHHHTAPSCRGQCPNPGEMPEARIGATAFGLLPFLGAGETHQVGKYQRTVAGGLRYLIARQGASGSLGESGGRMYSHGLATIALCEACGMRTAAMGKELVPPAAICRAAQAALNFVAFAQDPRGGGWRYKPKEAGDTSIVGWQMMGLTSGRLAGLRINPACFGGANKFLNYVQRNQYGSDYGYENRGKGTAATRAIGLLCRIYTGWPRAHPGIVQGAQALSTMGPQQGNMYYNYYATQVMHHFGGPPWKAWNTRMRDSLVASQARAGHLTGSWHFPGGDHGAKKGGRLYCTAMSAMTLEVYYRHLAVYQRAIQQQELKKQMVEQAQKEKQAEEKKKKEEAAKPHDEF